MNKPDPMAFLNDLLKFYVQQGGKWALKNGSLDGFHEFFMTALEENITYTRASVSGLWSISQN